MSTEQEHALRYQGNALFERESFLCKLNKVNLQHLLPSLLIS